MEKNDTYVSQNRIPENLHKILILSPAVGAFNPYKGIYLPHAKTLREDLEKEGASLPDHLRSAFNAFEKEPSENTLETLKEALKNARNDVSEGLRPKIDAFTDRENTEEPAEETPEEPSKTEENTADESLNDPYAKPLEITCEGVTFKAARRKQIGKIESEGKDILVIYSVEHPGKTPREALEAITGFAAELGLNAFLKAPLIPPKTYKSFLKEAFKDTDKTTLDYVITEKQKGSVTQRLVRRIKGYAPENRKPTKQINPKDPKSLIRAEGRKEQAAQQAKSSKREEGVERATIMIWHALGHTNDTREREKFKELKETVKNWFETDADPVSIFMNIMTIIEKTKSNANPAKGLECLIETGWLQETLKKEPLQVLKFKGDASDGFSSVENPKVRDALFSRVNHRRDDILFTKKAAENFSNIAKGIAKIEKESVALAFIEETDIPGLLDDGLKPADVKNNIAAGLNKLGEEKAIQFIKNKGIAGILEQNKAVEFGINPERFTSKNADTGQTSRASSDRNTQFFSRFNPGDETADLLDRSTRSNNRVAATSKSGEYFIPLFGPKRIEGFLDLLKEFGCSGVRETNEEDNRENGFFILDLESFLETVSKNAQAFEEKGYVRSLKDKKEAERYRITLKRLVIDDGSGNYYVTQYNDFGANSRNGELVSKNEKSTFEEITSILQGDKPSASKSKIEVVPYAEILSSKTKEPKIAVRIAEKLCEEYSEEYPWLEDFQKLIEQLDRLSTDAAAYLLEEYKIADLLDRKSVARRAVDSAQGPNASVHDIKTRIFDIKHSLDGIRPGKESESGTEIRSFIASNIEKSLIGTGVPEGLIAMPENSRFIENTLAQIVRDVRQEKISKPDLDVRDAVEDRLKTSAEPNTLQEHSEKIIDAVTTVIKGGDLPEGGRGRYRNYGYPDERFNRFLNSLADSMGLFEIVDFNLLGDLYSQPSNGVKEFMTLLAGEELKGAAQEIAEQIHTMSVSQKQRFIVERSLQRIMNIPAEREKLLENPLIYMYLRSKKISDAREKIQSHLMKNGFAPLKEEVIDSFAEKAVNQEMEGESHKKFRITGWSKFDEREFLEEQKLEDILGVRDSEQYKSLIAPKDIIMDALSNLRPDSTASRELGGESIVPSKIYQLAPAERLSAAIRLNDYVVPALNKLSDAEFYVLPQQVIYLAIADQKLAEKFRENPKSFLAAAPIDQDSLKQKILTVLLMRRPSSLYRNGMYMLSTTPKGIQDIFEPSIHRENYLGKHSQWPNPVYDIITSNKHTAEIFHDILAPVIRDAVQAGLEVHYATDEEEYALSYDLEECIFISRDLVEELVWSRNKALEYAAKIRGRIEKKKRKQTNVNAFILPVPGVTADNGRLLDLQKEVESIDRRIGSILENKDQATKDSLETLAALTAKKKTLENRIFDMTSAAKPSLRKRISGNKKKDPARIYSDSDYKTKDDLYLDALATLNNAPSWLKNLFQRDFDYLFKKAGVAGLTTTWEVRDRLLSSRFAAEIFHDILAPAINDALEHGILPHNPDSTGDVKEYRRNGKPRELAPDGVQMLISSRKLAQAYAEKLFERRILQDKPFRELETLMKELRGDLAESKVEEMLRFGWHVRNEDAKLLAGFALKLTEKRISHVVSHKDGSVSELYDVMIPFESQRKKLAALIKENPEEYIPAFKNLFTTVEAGKKDIVEQAGLPLIEYEDTTYTLKTQADLLRPARKVKSVFQEGLDEIEDPAIRARLDPEKSDLMKNLSLDASASQVFKNILVPAINNIASISPEKTGGIIPKRVYVFATDKIATERFLDDAETALLSAGRLWSNAAEMLAQGRYDAAAEYYSKIDERSRSNPDALNGLGYALLMEGKTEDAIGAFERALRLDAGNEVALLGLSAAHVRAGRASERKPLMDELTEKINDALDVPHARKTVSSGKKELLDRLENLYGDAVCGSLVLDENTAEDIYYGLALRYGRLEDENLFRYAASIVNYVASGDAGQSNINILVSVLLRMNESDDAIGSDALDALGEYYAEADKPLTLEYLQKKATELVEVKVESPFRRMAEVFGEQNAKRIRGWASLSHRMLEILASPEGRTALRQLGEIDSTGILKGRQLRTDHFETAIDFMETIENDASWDAVRRINELKAGLVFTSLRLHREWLTPLVREMGDRAGREVFEIIAEATEPETLIEIIEKDPHLLSDLIKEAKTPEGRDALLRKRKGIAHAISSHIRLIDDLKTSGDVTEKSALRTFIRELQKPSVEEAGEPAVEADLWEVAGQSMDPVALRKTNAIEKPGRNGQVIRLFGEVITLGDKTQPRTSLLADVVMSLGFHDFYVKRNPDGYVDNIYVANKSLDLLRDTLDKNRAKLEQYGFTQELINMGLLKEETFLEGLMYPGGGVNPYTSVSEIRELRVRNIIKLHETSTVARLLVTEMNAEESDDERLKELGRESRETLDSLLEQDYYAAKRMLLEIRNNPGIWGLRGEKLSAKINSDIASWSASGDKARADTYRKKTIAYFNEKGAPESAVLRSVASKTVEFLSVGKRNGRYVFFHNAKFAGGLTGEEKLLWEDLRAHGVTLESVHALLFPKASVQTEDIFTSAPETEYDIPLESPIIPRKDAGYVLEYTPGLHDILNSFGFEGFEEVYSSGNAYIQIRPGRGKAFVAFVQAHSEEFFKRRLLIEVKNEGILKELKKQKKPVIPIRGADGKERKYALAMAPQMTRIKEDSLISQSLELRAISDRINEYSQGEPFKQTTKYDGTAREILVNASRADPLTSGIRAMKKRLSQHSSKAPVRPGIESLGKDYLVTGLLARAKAGESKVPKSFTELVYSAEEARDSRIIQLQIDWDSHYSAGQKQGLDALLAAASILSGDPRIAVMNPENPNDADWLNKYFKDLFLKDYDAYCGISREEWEYVKSLEVAPVVGNYHASHMNVEEGKLYVRVYPVRLSGEDVARIERMTGVRVTPRMKNRLETVMTWYASLHELGEAVGRAIVNYRGDREHKPQIYLKNGEMFQYRSHMKNFSESFPMKVALSIMSRELGMPIEKLMSIVYTQDVFGLDRIGPEYVAEWEENARLSAEMAKRDYGFRLPTGLCGMQKGAVVLSEQDMMPFASVQEIAKAAETFEKLFIAKHGLENLRGNDLLYPEGLVYKTLETIGDAIGATTEKAAAVDLLLRVLEVFDNGVLEEGLVEGTLELYEEFSPGAGKLNIV